uniref:Fibroblast growth factor n=1 Tax=Petromyzon marinus TaxID=7757 RepID=S4RM96_PETMA
AALIVLGSVLLTLLLAVPATWRARRDPEQSPPPPTAPSPPPPPSWRRRLTGGERRQSPSRAVRDLRRPHGWARMARRRGRLYCQVGIGFHLQLRPSGKISGTHRANSFSVLEIFSVARGVVGIWGVSSRRFLAMNRKGKLYATSSFTDECLFAESFQENGHNTYASERYGAAAGSGGEGAWLVALNKLGRARRGTSPRVRRQHASTHFLPRLRR